MILSFCASFLGFHQVGWRAQLEAETYEEILNVTDEQGAVAKALPRWAYWFLSFSDASRAVGADHSGHHLPVQGICGLRIWVPDSSRRTSYS